MKARDDHPGQLFLSDRQALFVGRVSDTSVHAHYWVQLALGLDAPFQLCTEAGSEECGAAVIPPRARHAVKAPEGNVLLLYLDPTVRPGERVAASCKGQGVRTYRVDEVSDCVAGIKRRLSTGSDRSVVESLVNQILSVLVPNASTESRLDPRVREVLTLLDNDHAGTRQLPELASHVGLSPGRLRHLFVEQTGIPIRSYRSWARLRRGMALLAGGAGLTKAAHSANFVDSAHLSRTFRDAFGVTPSELVRSRIEVTGNFEPSKE